MAKESRIIYYINKYLQARMTDKRFSGKQYFGLTELIENNKDRVPVCFTKEGEIKYVGIDDKFPIIVYHRSNGSEISYSNNKFGAGNNDLIEKTNLSMFVFAQWKKIKMSISELKDFICLCVPDKVDSVSCGNIGVKSAFININSTDFNSLEIYNKEYRVEKKLNPNFLLLEIKYSIECRYNRFCVKTSDCIASKSGNYLLQEIGESILLENEENIILE